MSLATAEISGAGEIGVRHGRREMAGDKRKLQLVGPLVSMSISISLMLCRLLISVLVRALVKLLELTGIRRQDNAKLQVEEKQLGMCAQSSRGNKLPANTGRPITRAPQFSQVSQPIQMSQKLVAGIEEQQVAHELSAQVVEEALWAIVNQFEKEAGARGVIMAEEVAAEEQMQRDLQNFTGKEETHEELSSQESNLKCDDKIKIEIKIKSETQNSTSNANHANEDEEQLDMSCGESLASSRDSDEYAGQQASEITLRQLKLSALEDVLVCGQNRHSTESARRLFSELSRPAKASCGGHQTPGIEISSVARRHVKAAANQRGSSLSSHSSCCDDEQETEENNNSTSQLDRAHENIDYLEELLGFRSGSSASRGFPPEHDNGGTIKLNRRCCSSSSSASSNGNFGRTLVCSVSPTSQIRSSPNGGGHAQGVDINAQISGGGGGDDEDLYPINGDEIRQCRAAFRENRRLIERVQVEACRRLQRQQRDEHATGGGLKRSSSQGAFENEEQKDGHRARVIDKSHWANSLGRRSRLPDCARCGLKLYPLDKMELDFTRTTLNIHRNCFKCQVCATLLRLETYASIDGKLYCPAHIRCISLSR